MRVLSSRMDRPPASTWNLPLRVSVLIAAPTVALAIAACTPDTNPPTGQGDNVITDVDGSGPVEQQQQGGDAGAPSASLDSGYGYGTLGDASSGAVTLCAQCGCEGGTFCFGGSASSPASACGVASGLGSSAPMTGCNPIPAGCDDGGDDCACLLQAIAPQLSCYPVCVGTSDPKTLFCPH